MEVVWQVQPAFLQAAFDVIDSDYGGLLNYLSGSVGIQVNELQQLRHALLER
jgi:protein-tyrosine phosphatase